MAKLTLSDLTSLANAATAVTRINANNALIEGSLEKTLSRDGTSPNQMLSSLDMNSFRILNLPTPVYSTEPVRLGDIALSVEEFQSDGVYNPNYTGSVTRTIISKLKDVLTTSDFNFVGDGTTDNSAALLAACNAAMTRGGTLLWTADINGLSDFRFTDLTTISPPDNNHLALTILVEPNVKISYNVITGFIKFTGVNTAPDFSPSLLGIAGAWNQNAQLIPYSGQTGSYTHNFTGAYVVEFNKCLTFSIQNISFLNNTGTNLYAGCLNVRNSFEGLIQRCGFNAGGEVGINLKSEEQNNAHGVSSIKICQNQFTQMGLGASNSTGQDISYCIRAEAVAGVSGNVTQSWISQNYFESNYGRLISFPRTGGGGTDAIDGLTHILNNHSDNNVGKYLYVIGGNGVTWVGGIVQELVCTDTVIKFDGDSFSMIGTVFPGGASPVTAASTGVINITSGANRASFSGLVFLQTNSSGLIVDSSSGLTSNFSYQDINGKIVNHYGGASTNLKIGAGGIASTYNIVSLNGVDTTTGSVGICSGGAGDTNLYLTAPASKAIVARINGTNVMSVDSSGKLFAAGNTAIPAGGAQGIGVSTTNNFGIYYGSGVPSVSAAKGSIYLRSDGSSTSTRMYVNTDGSTTWTNVVTAA